ncbi:hypothetical protein CU048_00500 [Beijerinckiaceae bacterium]|nr:hypothetical protein CU048_00500 [Beijerinckiaceae bacterium]
MEEFMKLFGKILVTTTVSILASSGAIAQNYNYYYGPLPPNPPPSWLAEGRSVQDWQNYRYDYSGTAGRMGLGADPAHPEGPGNFSSPR